MSLTCLKPSRSTSTTDAAARDARLRELAPQVIDRIVLFVDGHEVRLSDTVAYKGMMLSGVPNFAYAIGYTNSSWTLKIGLLCTYLCRLLRHMDDNGYDVAYAAADPTMPTRPLLDFGAGYVQRSLADLPRQGPNAPWLMSMNYDHDRKLLRKGDVELRLFTTLMTFGSPQDVTLEELRVEAFFPADRTSEEQWHLLMATTGS